MFMPGFVPEVRVLLGVRALFTPEVSIREPLFDEVLDLWICNGQERTDVVSIAVDHVVAKLKDIQRRLDSFSCSTLGNQSQSCPMPHQTTW